MLIKIISEYSRFVIFLIFAALLSSACSFAPSQSRSNSPQRNGKSSAGYQEANILGRIKSSTIKESSGIVHSRCQNDVFWTHNDSGDGNYIFAVNKKAELVGKWRVTGASNRDWEDIASFKDANGNCSLYVGDIGNNGRIRGSLTVYKVKEPKVGRKSSATRRTESAESITFSYPDLRHDAEALFVHPKTREIYVITKRMSGAAGVYKLQKGSKTAKKIANIEVPSLPNGLITGAGISPDGNRVIVCDYFGGYEFILPDNAKAFDEIWKQKPRLVDLGKREQGEAVDYSADGLAVYATSENRNAPLIEVKRKVED